MGFREQFKVSTADGNELVEVVLGVLRDQNASNRELCHLSSAGLLLSKLQPDTRNCIARESSRDPRPGSK